MNELTENELKDRLEAEAGKERNDDLVVNERTQTNVCATQ
jgi:hypothetical protein